VEVHAEDSVRFGIDDRTSPVRVGGWKNAALAIPGATLVVPAGRWRATMSRSFPFEGDHKTRSDIALKWSAYESVVCETLLWESSATGHRRFSCPFGYAFDSRRSARQWSSRLA
jgi:hypothetical protein